MTIENLPLKDSVKQSSGQLMQIQKRMNHMNNIFKKQQKILLQEKWK